jgi:predicted  nucleic acid-binding Zn-ribbon protein
MVDADSVLQGVQERDKWRRRAEFLERSLREVRERRRRLEARLKRLERDLVHLQMIGDSMGEIARPAIPVEVRSAPRGPLF